MRKHQKSICYFCGNKSTSQEHAPAKMFFSGFECDSITVPSCELHNSLKSFDDQSIVSTLIQSLNNWKTASNREYAPEIETAIKKAKSSFERTKRRVTNVQIIDKSNLVDMELPKITHYKGKIETWIRQLTSALVHDATHKFDATIDWNASFVNSPHWISSGMPVDLPIETIIDSAVESKRITEMEKDLEWLDGWSAHPKPYPRLIYRFSFLFGETDGSVMVKHVFYDSYTWFVLFYPSLQTIEAIRLKALGK